ncbi:MAG: transcription elongation factor GreB [Burkholderiales bacterium]|jgi:transcription elongation factor GreB|nr:transcription elongation factor GreB [Burkholderiales bacterium]
MNKAFTRESDTAPDEDDEVDAAPPLPAGSRNYMTPGGFARLKDELDRLVAVERPELIATVAWAASNGDRSENADYQYGKRRLREIERRIRFLVKRLDAAEVVDPESRARDGIDQVFFGATVDYAARDGERRTISIVGIDETDTARGYVSWIAPVARALTKAREGDVVTFRTPAGIEEIEVLEVRYVPLATGAPPGRLG